MNVQSRSQLIRGCCLTAVPLRGVSVAIGHVHQSERVFEMMLYEMAAGRVSTSVPKASASLRSRASTPVSFALGTLAPQFEPLEIFHVILVRLRLLWELTTPGLLSALSLPVKLLFSV